MEALKKIFPLSFKYTKDVPNLIIGILIQLVVGIIAGVLIGILAKVPVVNLVVGLVGGLVDLYVKGQLARALLGCAPAHTVSVSRNVGDFFCLHPLTLFRDGCGTVMRTLGNNTHVFNFM